MKLKDLETSPKKNLYLIGLSVLVGLTAGLLASLYRLVLEKAEAFGRFAYAQVLHAPMLALILIPSLLLIAVVITFMMKKYPMSSGSGIPQVKGQLQGAFKANWFTTAFAKFVAGSLAMLGGLSLGREGPSVQLGASMGQMVGGKLAQTERHRRILMASGASAGLSAAFNAPLSGVMFTLEEVFKYFSPLLLLTCMTSAIVSDAVSQLFFGRASVFHFVIKGEIALQDYWLLIILGLILGAFGALYNTTLLAGQKWMNKISNVYWRVVLSFAATAFMAMVFPLVIGSGHSLINQLAFGWGLGFLLLVLLGKFFISMISYVSGIPGGIFFPLLVLGAVIGAIFATLAINGLNLPESWYANFVILAMAGTFTAIVRAPMTGILLLVEMTGSFSYLLPLALVSLVAYVVADLFNSEPIYDSLLANMLADKSNHTEETLEGQLVIETIVQFDSKAENKRIAQLVMPHDCLIVAIHRVGKDIIPNGQTELLAGDYLTLMIGQNNEDETRRQVQSLFSEKEMTEE
ncbi:MAG: ClC family H(+)/Cl(-) exchange transporter [Lactococcus sp.]